MQRILITNDDGLNATGIMALRDSLSDVGELFVVAPDRERSTVSHALTLSRPLRIREIGKNTYTVDGTPSDCVNIAIGHILKDKIPDLVISGINHGPNLGDDIIYSGTVAAAMEGTMSGIPSVAISLAGHIKKYDDFKLAGIWANRIARKILEVGLPEGTLLNVNIPAQGGDITGYGFTTMGKRMYSKSVEKRKDPSGDTYYWLAGKPLKDNGKPGTDCSEILNNKVTITPLKINNTDHDFLESLDNWNL